MCLKFRKAIGSDMLLSAKEFLICLYLCFYELANTQMFPTFIATTSSTDIHYINWLPKLINIIKNEYCDIKVAN